VSGQSVTIVRHIKVICDTICAIAMVTIGHGWENPWCWVFVVSFSKLSMK